MWILGLQRVGAGNALSRICEKKNLILLEENKYRKIILVVFLFSLSGMETSLFNWFSKTYICT